MKCFSLALLLLAACGGPNSGLVTGAVLSDSLVQVDSAVTFSGSIRSDNTLLRDTAVIVHGGGSVNTKSIKPAELVAFAQTLLGTPYVYGSTDPKVGFDCSGFITYTFNHFGISVPRSSRDFRDVGLTIPPDSARSGDLILFTGTSPEEKGIGHMGLIVKNEASGIEFIHATSGKAMSVAITPFNEYYQGRFVRIARIFP